MTTLRRRTLAGLAAAALAIPRMARAETVEITVHYAQPHIYKDAKEAIAAAFARVEPGIRISWLTSPDYNDGLQLVLRQAAAGTGVDLSFQALNRLRVLTERGLAQDLAPLLAREGDPAALGYTPNILDLGRIGTTQAGLAFSASNSIAYLNGALLDRAGVSRDALPTSWDGVLDIAARLSRLPDAPDPLFFDWAITEWHWSALLLGQGGRWMNPQETRFLLDSPEGNAAMALFERIVRDGRMPNLTSAAAQQAFGAGKLGMRFASTANLRNMIRTTAQNFPLITMPMPVIDPQKGCLPVGGSAGVLMARDAAKREAAWKFLRFATGPEGTALMARNTGYVPVNQIAIDDPQYLGEFYRENPLYLAATRQLPITIEWYAFPGSNGVRISQAIVDNLARIVEGRAPAAQVVQDTQREVTRLLPRAS
ncbi:extracellular solute-binding protein [Roseomonas sp. HJA6]|uniref:Extracellular solute-binding protein n=1 Tax=Roseomonas alba TaxID=2846776 RepID=A0ABS7A7Q9_9PROT|nr:extracellular solute-binding protein [Neoroseomonas alba]MBW6398336.1 extracellular solute-binding protein [Neoroseomonas alba]